MPSIAEQCAQLLRERNAISTQGLTDAELDAAEAAFGFVFGVDHRELLRIGMPTSGPDWRRLDDSELDNHTWLLDGVLFDVEQNAFWPPSWGVRPSSQSAARALATEHVAEWPRLIPLWGHRFTPSGASGGAPVFSAWQTDVIFYGDDLVKWAKLEFSGGSNATSYPWDYLLPWSAFAYGEEDRV